MNGSKLKAWNCVHPDYKQVVQETNLRKQCFEGVFLVQVRKSTLILTILTGLITGKEISKFHRSVKTQWEKS